MNFRAVSPLVFLAACSSSSSNSTSTPVEGGVASDANVTVDASAMSADASTEASAYEQAAESATWQAVANAPTAPAGAKMDDIYFPSAMVGYAVSGAASSIYKTIDGGVTWAVSFNNPGTYFRSLDFIDENHGFASNLGAGLSDSITDTNVLYETINGGTTWTPVTAITGTLPSGICNQFQIDATHLVAVGRVMGPAYIMMSSDGGASWTSTSLNDQLSMLIDARFTSPTDGIVIGSTPGDLSGGDPPFYCTILHTGDGGSTWDTVFTSKTEDSLCWKMSFPSSNVGYVSVQDAGGAGPPSFVKTNDGGKTWAEKPLPTNKSGFYPGIGIGFLTETIGWVSADYTSTDAPEPTYRTIDGGETWTVDATLKSPINRFRFLSPTSAVAIGGTIWKLDIN
jgi:photosystem II stability/assembly factor-like uncharacterized protein